MPPKGSKKAASIPLCSILPNPVEKGLDPKKAPPLQRGSGPAGTVLLTGTIDGIDMSPLNEILRAAAKDGPDPEQFKAPMGAGGGSK
jgi:hypothetical protein